MEIISFIIVVGLLLSSCETDDGKEEIIFFKNEADRRKWQNNPHQWTMPHEKMSWQQTESLSTPIAWTGLKMAKEKIIYHQNFISVDQKQSNKVIILNDQEKNVESAELSEVGSF